jgi:predicted enzyme related to lactoylglutathione lyase
LMTGSEGGSWQILHDPEGNEFCLCELQESGA